MVTSRKFFALALAVLIVVSASSLALADEPLILDTWGYATSLNTLADMYYQETGVEVVVNVGGSGSTGVPETVAVKIASGAPTDIVMLQTLDVAAQSVVMDLGQFILADDLNLDEYFDTTIASCNKDLQASPYGQLTLPIFVYSPVILYNQTLFDEAGLPSPMDLFAAGEWTWDRFIDTAIALTKDTDGDGVIDQFGYANEATDSMVEQFVFGVTGGTIVSEDRKAYTGNSPEYIRGVEMLQELVHDRKAFKLDAWNVPTFTSGKAGMTWGAPWVAGVTRTAKVVTDLRIAPFPQNDPSQPVCEVLCDSVGISKGSKQPEKAWEFIKWLVGETAQNDIARHSLPPLVSVATEKWAEGVFDTVPYDRRAYVYVASAQALPPSIPVPTTIRQVFANAINATVVENVKAPSQAYNEIAAQVQAMLNEWWATME